MTSQHTLHSTSTTQAPEMSINHPAAPIYSPQQLGNMLRTVFDRCFQYSVAHCQIRSHPVTDPNVHPNTRRMLQAMCISPQQVYDLLQDHNSKSTVIAKLLCSYLESNILKVEAFNSIDSQHANLIQGIQNLSYDQMPVPVRTVMLRNLQNSFERLVQLPNIRQGSDTLITAHGNRLWAYIQPLFGHKTTADWHDLRQMIEEALKICAQLFRHPARYIFTYFQTGDTFLHNEMTAVSPNHAAIPGQFLEGQRYTVAFCVTPRVEMRTYIPNGLINTVTITKATVLCNPPAIAKPALPAPTSAPSPFPRHDPRKTMERYRGY